MRSSELPFVQSMFDHIAPHYDLLNRILSLRQDVMWRRKLVSALDLPPDGRLLDVACGTCDVGIEAVRTLGSEIRVTGVDFSRRMLAQARRKIAQAGLSEQIQLIAGDAFDLPVAAEGFDALSIAFGIRNLQDRVAALVSFRRRLKPGGVLTVLELTTPPPGILHRLYLLYFRRLLPRIGGVFSQNRAAYTYLPDSVLKFPRPLEFARMMRRAGYARVTWLPLSMGIATLFKGRTPVRL
ncbi:MAG: bifunctional demethylmenaquinone methyltransferase/2-methoxy-6-polyprenyl-1,4-benzoquinol methylase UbiE [Desulfosarcinaceae bacterium]|nr:bifunctional demethylmenaquinone methyltransferase/2-methoxy-6-polyprenyl-1,4-benzoquinol methylase UbiE [Desulfosarcinaceae bacterium]